MANNNMTAVEWLIEQISEKQPNGFYVIDTLEDVKRIFEKAKQMEKEQMKESWFDSTLQFDNPASMVYKKEFEQYYNETYGKDSNESNA